MGRSKNTSKKTKEVENKVDETVVNNDILDEMKSVSMMSKEEDEELKAASTLRYLEEKQRKMEEREAQKKETEEIVGNGEGEEEVVEVAETDSNGIETAEETEETPQTAEEIEKEMDFIDKMQEETEAVVEKENNKAQRITRPKSARDYYGYDWSGLCYDE